MKLSLQDQFEFTDQGATVYYQNSNDTIEGHMLKAKVFRSKDGDFNPPTSYQEAKERPADALKIGSMYLPKHFYQHLYASLWLQYLSNHPNLVEELMMVYTECEHPILNLFIKDKGQTLIKEIKPFLRIIQGKERLVYVKGDILETYAPIICHNVNCLGTLTNDFSKRIIQRYSNLYFAYRDWLYGLNNKLLGDCQWVKCESHIIVNLYGHVPSPHEPNVCYTHLDALKAALLKTKTEAKRRQYTIAIPYGLGCESGNLTWEVVLPMIEDVFRDYYVLIYQNE